jgi:hypothetical protein
MGGSEIRQQDQGQGSFAESHRIEEQARWKQRLAVK